MINVGSQESNVGKFFFNGNFCSAPDACSLNVDANEISMGEFSRKCDGVFSLATSQLESNWILVSENCFIPLSLQISSKLIDVRKCSELIQMFEFIFSHKDS